MFKNLRNKLAVLALIALGLAFGNAWSSQAIVQHPVLTKLLGHDDGCTPKEAVDAVEEWIKSDNSTDALFKIAIYNMTGNHGLKNIPLSYTYSGTSHKLDSISDCDQEILFFLFAVKDKFGTLQEHFKRAVLLSGEGGSCWLGCMIGVASCLSVVNNWEMPELSIQTKKGGLKPYTQTNKIEKARFSSFVDYVQNSKVEHNTNLTALMKSIYEELMNSSKQKVITEQRTQIAAHLVGKSIKVVSEAKDIKDAFSGNDKEKTMVICFNDQGSLTFSNWGGRNTANKLVLVVHEGKVDIAHFGPIAM